MIVNQSERNYVQSFYQNYYVRPSQPRLGAWDAGRHNNNYTDSQAIRGVQSLADSASDMYDAIDKLGNKSTFQNYSASSSNDKFVKVDKSSEPTSAKEFKVEVDQIAAAQKNRGLSLDSDSLYSGATGWQKFEIDIDGEKHEFSVNVEAGDTNSQVLRKMANAVTSADIGVEARVANNSKNGTSSLVFESEKTGDLAENRFTVSDAAGGSLVANTGISNMRQAAQDAVYSVDGVSHTSHDNDVELDSEVSITLRGATRRPVTVSSEKDNSEAMKLADDFVTAYNDLLSLAKSGTNGSDRLLRSLNNVSSAYKSRLERAGISVNSDGSLSVDKKKLKKAAESGDLEDAFTEGGGVNYGLSYRMEKIASDVKENPSYYMGKTNMRSRQQTSATYVTGGYNPWATNRGLLMNWLI